ncbi:DUF4386 family protein [Sphingobacterium sp. Ag1]|uniref:DUF4386 family protein n=1 Tax=Sphingobacterium sp. Ag1 TaxID=1643451 RepID=UPI00069A33F9|nr:DUF4386 family protein [Sphingobacterium sp. Ag1]
MEGLLSGQNMFDSQMKLLLATLILAIPALMIFLSLMSNTKFTKWLNIAMGVFFTLFTMHCSPFHGYRMNLGMAYVPKQLFAWDDPVKTFHNILDHETMSRLSLASSVLCYLAFIFLAIALDYLLSSTNEIVARTMALLATITVPISLMNLQNKCIIYLQ